MKQINIKNRLYVLPVLLFFMHIQSIIFCDLDQSAQNSLDAVNLNLIRKQSMYAQKEQQNTDGSFDTTFGIGGYFISDLIGTSLEVQAVAIRPYNNKIVVAGSRENKAVLVQYHDNGSSLDIKFGGVNGTGVVINNTNNSSFHAIAIQKDKKIVAAGKAGNNFFLTRYYENGTLDTLFGDQGTGFANINNQAREITAIALQGDNIIVAGDDNTGAIVLTRFNRFGILDTNFAPTFHTPKPGIRITRIGAEAHANALAIQPDNKIVVVGSGAKTEKYQMVIVRYTENGELDTDFGDDQTGIVAITIGNVGSSAYGVAIQKDGKIVVVGQSHHLGDRAAVFTTIRLNADGTLDSSFGKQGGGIVITRPRGAPHAAYARSVALIDDPLTGDEKIVVMGYVNADTINYFTLLRYDTYGDLDTTFGVQGIRSNTLNNNLIFNRSTLPVFGALQNNKDKLVLAGNYAPTSTAVSSQVAVARYLA